MAEVFHPNAHGPKAFRQRTDGTPLHVGIAIENEGPIREQRQGRTEPDGRARVPAVKGPSGGYPQ